MTEYTSPQSFDFGAAIGQGFNLPGGKSYLIRVAAWSALVLTIVYAALGTPIVKAFVDMMANAIEMEVSLDGAGPNPEDFMAVMAPMFRAMGLMMLIGLLQMAVFAAAEAAIYRNLFHKEDRGVFPLMFGMDELRVFGTRLVIGFILGAIYMGLYVAVILIGTIAAAINSGIFAALAGLLIFALVVAAIAGFVWATVKLAPASAYAVKLRAFNPFASWEPMKGLVWSAIGSYLVLYLIGYFILSFVLLIVFVIFFLSSGIIGALMKLETSEDVIPDLSALGEQLTSAGFIIPLLITIFISLFASLIWYGAIWSMWGYFAKDKQDALWRPETSETSEAKAWSFED